jgi:hypothetical protein
MSLLDTTVAPCLGEFEALSRFWFAAEHAASSIAMMTLYCDESDDGRSYALAGWLAVPSAWDTFDRAWREMLLGLVMPDGTPCRAFHGAEIVGRAEISGSKFKGWTFEDEVNAFTRAVDVITNRQVCPLMWPVGVSVEIPRTFTWVPRDSVWLILYLKMFQLLAATYPAQRSISWMFDEKPGVAGHAATIWSRAKNVMNARVGEEYLHGVLSFGADEDVMGLQAADLLAYEWRKRITDGRHQPTKPVRRSYTRLRQSRPDGALWRYGLEVFKQALKADDQSVTWARAVLSGQPTHRD